MADPGNAPGLRRALGLRAAVALGVGGTVGGGIFVLVGSATAKAGPAALAAFPIAFAAALLIALPYAELACRLPLAGGGYAFARQVLGPRWGFAMGWIYWGAYVFVSGYVTVGFGGYLAAATGLPVRLGAVALVVVCTGVNLLGVRIAGAAQTIVIVVAVAGLAGFAAWGLPDADPARFVPFAPHGAGGILLAALPAFLAFGGFDMIAAAGEEVRDPGRNLPRAILATLFTVLALYVLVSYVALGTLPWERLGSSTAPLADAARAFGGAAGRHLVVGCALLTTTATANAVVVVTSRTLFAVARDRLLPARLAHVGERTGVPWPAVLLSGALMALVAAGGSVAVASAAGGFLFVLHFVPPLIALVVLRRRGGDRPRFATPLPWIVLPLAFATSGLLIVASGVVGIAVGGAWLLLGGVAYAVHIRRRVLEQSLENVTAGR
jgi:APA family basic amino acid/polyamine antiporter